MSSTPIIQFGTKKTALVADIGKAKDAIQTEIHSLFSKLQSLCAADKESCKQVTEGKGHGDFPPDHFPFIESLMGKDDKVLVAWKALDDGTRREYDASEKLITGKVSDSIREIIDWMKIPPDGGTNEYASQIAKAGDYKTPGSDNQALPSQGYDSKLENFDSKSYEGVDYKKPDSYEEIPNLQSEKKEDSSECFVKAFEEGFERGLQRGEEAAGTGKGNNLTNKK